MVTESYYYLQHTETNMHRSFSRISGTAVSTAVPAKKLSKLKGDASCETEQHTASVFSYSTTILLPCFFTIMQMPLLVAQSKKTASCI